MHSLKLLKQDVKKLEREIEIEGILDKEEMTETELERVHLAVNNVIKHGYGTIKIKVHTKKITDIDSTISTRLEDKN